MPRKGQGYQVACELQKVLAANVLDPSTDKKLIASMCVAWERLQERKRIMRMQPAPKPLDVTVKHAEPRRRAEAFSEPTR